MGIGIEIGNGTVRERGSGTRREGTIGAETMVALVAVGRHMWREQHEEHRRDDDRCREFRRDDERGHRRGCEEGLPAHRGGGGGGGGRARKDAGGGATPERRSPSPDS